MREGAKKRLRDRERVEDAAGMRCEERNILTTTRETRKRGREKDKGEGGRAREKHRKGERKRKREDDEDYLLALQYTAPTFRS